MTGIPSTVPYGADQTLYLVMDAVGPRDLWLQNPIERPDLDTVINDMLLARFNNPVGIYAFNTLEHWSRDLSDDVAREIESRCDMDGVPVPDHVRDFVQRASPERASPRLGSPRLR